MRKKRKKEKKTDIVICTDARVLTRVLEMSGTSFGKQSEGIWLACLSMIVNMKKRDFECNDDEYVDVDLLCRYGNVSGVRVK